MLVNDIHGPMLTFMMHLTSVTLTEGSDKGLRLNSSLAGQLLLNFSLQISTLLPTLNSFTTVGYLLGVFYRLWIPFLVRISTSAWSQQWKLELKLF